MVRCFAEHRWRTLELHYIHGCVLLKTDDPDGIGTRFRRFAEDYGISFPQGHFFVVDDSDESSQPIWFDIAPASDKDFVKAMNEMRRWIDFFNALGVRAGVLHIGGFTLKQQGWCDERIFARRVEALAMIAEYAKDGPTAICLENMKAPFGVETVTEVLGIASAVDSDSMAACLDTGHANLAGISIPEFILKAGPKLKALHVHDNPGQTDDHILPYGRGTIRWEHVLLALRTVNYDGLFNFEIPGESKCPEPIRMAKLDYALRLAELMIDLDKA